MHHVTRQQHTRYEADSFDAQSQRDLSMQCPPLNGVLVLAPWHLHWLLLGPWRSDAVLAKGEWLDGVEGLLPTC